jgi:hypothetical protein
VPEKYNLAEARFAKSTRSGNSGNCVEVATNLVTDHGVILVRDSKDPSGPVLAFTAGEWEAFTGGVCGGEFNL